MRRYSLKAMSRPISSHPLVAITLLRRQAATRYKISGIVIQTIAPFLNLNEGLWAARATVSSSCPYPFHLGQVVQLVEFHPRSASAKGRRDRYQFVTGTTLRGECFDCVIAAFNRDDSATPTHNPAASRDQ